MKTIKISNGVKKITSWHLLTLVLIASVFSLALAQKYVLAAWIQPTSAPSASVINHLVSTPMAEDLDLNDQKIFGDKITIDPFGANTIDVIGVGNICFDGDCKASWADVSGIADNLGDHTATQNIVLGAKYLSGDGTDNGIYVSPLVGSLGYVGIGTNVPNKQLHIKTASGNAEIDIQSAASLYWGIYQDDTSDDLRFWNNNINLVTFDDNGNVGIGVGELAPAYKLEVVGNLNATQLCIAGDCQVAWPTSGLWTANGAKIYYNSGNVGIGTIDPNKLLHLKTDTGTNAEMDIQSGSSAHWGIYQDETTADLRFWNVSNIMTITNEGRVSIGATDPGTNILYVSTAASGTAAIRGEASATGSGVVGVGFFGLYGFGSHTTPGAGVVGSGFYGVYGSSSSIGGSGVAGSGYYGLYGYGSDTAGAGIKAEKGTSPLAGEFIGTVKISGGYLQIPTASAGPTASDCDSDAERGYLGYDYTNNKLYICDGATEGWNSFDALP